MLELGKSSFGGVLFLTKKIKEKFFIMLKCQRNTSRLAEKVIIFTALCLNMKWVKSQRNA